MTETHEQGTVSVDRALLLMRFGWAVAEFRGRVYFGSNDPGRLIKDDVAQVRRSGHGLPLSEERSPAELRIESVKLVQFLAEKSKLEFPGEAAGCDSDPHPSALKGVINLAGHVGDEDNEARGPAWDAFAESLYKWDARIQDSLVGESFGASSAYQLGRALAECSWGLDPRSDPDSFTGWAHVFGTERCLAINRLTDRVAPALPYPGLTPDVIKGSLAAWQRLASDEQWRSDSMAPVHLRDQTVVWRDLLLARIDPRLLAQPKASLQRIGSIFPAVKAVWIYLAASLLFVVMLAAGAWLITKYGSNGPWGEITVGLGAFGITASGLSARAKATANSLMTQIRHAVQADEVVEACTRRPPRPRKASVKEPGRLALPGSVAAPVTLTMLSQS